MEVTVQKTVEAFEAVRYSRAKRALGYWNNIVQTAERMINSSDEGMKYKFLNSLLHDMVEVMLKSWSINIELARPDEFIEVIHQMEVTLYYISSHQQAEGESEAHFFSLQMTPQMLSGPYRDNWLVCL
jgi:hypothetical protein